MTARAATSADGPAGRCPGLVEGRTGQEKRPVLSTHYVLAP